MEERGTGQLRMKAQSGKYALERIAEKMVGNGREWLIDLGQGPVRTESREKWDEAQLGGDESSMVVPPS